MFGCPHKHLTDELAGVDDTETWACPLCHCVFKKIERERNGVKQN